MSGTPWARHIISEVEWLVGHRDHEDMAVALGYANAKSLAKMLRRWGRPDLAAKTEGHKMTERLQEARS